MRLVLRIAMIALQIVTLVAVTAAVGKGYSYLMAETYDGRFEPSRHFPVIAVEASGAPSSTPAYQLIRWSELKDAKRKDPSLRFWLPAPQGQFKLPAEKGFVPSVRFKVVEVTSASQRVELTWAEDDYETYAEYITDGTSVQPRYYRLWGAASMFIGLIPGLIAAWLLGRLFRRRGHEGADVSIQPKSRP